MILPALERLVRQMERTIRHFALNFDNARVEKIYVSSGVEPHPRILDYIGDELGLPIESHRPLRRRPRISYAAPAPRIRFGEELVRAGHGHGAGHQRHHAELSPHPQGQAQGLHHPATSTAAVLACFLGLMLACTGFAFWQEQQIKEKDIQKAQPAEPAQQL
ncbi:MAG: hypothetical protein MZV70_46130 [Desulfobacterales bacterium]|nr:hypothetical protein [Desulfobacterales bacterium]